MTVEFAVAVTAVVVVLCLFAGAVGLLSEHLTLTTRAAQAARLLARGEPLERVHGEGVAFTAHRGGGVVCVIAVSTSAAARSFGIAPRARGCALDTSSDDLSRRGESTQ